MVYTEYKQTEIVMFCSEVKLTPKTIHNDYERGL